MLVESARAPVESTAPFYPTSLTFQTSCFAAPGANATPPGRIGEMPATGSCRVGRLEPKGQRPQGTPCDGDESLAHPPRCRHGSGGPRTGDGYGLTQPSTRLRLPISWGAFASWVQAEAVGEQ